MILSLPAQTQSAPLVLVLHGYGESAEVMRSKTHFDDAAVPAGYGVAYVTGAPNPNDATSSNCWNSGIDDGGKDDVAFLCAMASYLQEEYGFDPGKTYAIGFSNGGVMMHRRAMEASDTFSAVVSVAGMMPESIWNERTDTAGVSVFEIYGEKDDVVPKNSDGSAKYNKAPAIEDVMEYWAVANASTAPDSDTGDAQSEETVGKDSTLIKHQTAADRQVWQLVIKGARHNWPDQNLTGIDANALILDFFEALQ